MGHDIAQLSSQRQASRLRFVEKKLAFGDDVLPFRFPIESWFFKFQTLAYLEPISKYLEEGFKEE